MDLETLEQYASQKKNVGKEYIQKIKSVINQENFSEYRDVLERIIDTEKILEQEAELLVLNDKFE